MGNSKVLFFILLLNVDLRSKYFHYVLCFFGLIMKEYRFGLWFCLSVVTMNACVKVLNSSSRFVL